MPLTIADFSAAVRSATSEGLQALVASQILDRTPFCFANDTAQYVSLQSHLAERLDAKPDEVILVGSGAVGFTVAAGKFPKPFHAESDLDFAIISPALFDAAWTSLLKWGHPIRREVPPQERDWFEARRANIFWGWMDPARLKFSSINRPSLLNELRDFSLRWFETFQSLGLDFPGTEVATRTVSARLYRTKEHLLHYQTQSLQQLQAALNEGNASNEVQ